MTVNLRRVNINGVNYISYGKASSTGLPTNGNEIVLNGFIYVVEDKQRVDAHAQKTNNSIMNNTRRYPI